MRSIALLAAARLLKAAVETSSCQSSSAAPVDGTCSNVATGGESGDQPERVVIRGDNAAASDSVIATSSSLASDIADSSVLLASSKALWEEDEPSAIVAKPSRESLPLLMFISQKALQKANQGLDWAIMGLKKDEDGDAAHAFLGPFTFANSRQDSKNAKT
eukprot:jgi/Bigna1/146027/aug1.107_g20735